MAIGQWAIASPEIEMLMRRLEGSPGGASKTE
jgi:hypothetical protein